MEFGKILIYIRKLLLLFFFAFKFINWDQFYNCCIPLN